MTLEQLYLAMLAGGVVLLVSVVATRVASLVGLPSLLLYLAFGVALGEDGVGIKFDDAQLAQNLGTAALAVILIEGGLTTRWTDVRSVLAPAGALATLGVGISTLVTAAGAHWILGFSWQLALLLGATVSSTDAAAVFAILRVLPLPKRVAGLLEAESGFNDAPTVILVVLLSEVPFHFDPLPFAGSLLYELALGVVIGLGIGWLGGLALARLALPASGLYPLATFGLGIVAFAAAGAAHASGFLAAYLAALVLGNLGLAHRAATNSFAEGLGWLAQIGLFVLLGLLVSPSRLPHEVGPALVVGLVLLVVARPLAVLASLLPFSIPLRELSFLSWAGLRGAVPIVLATFPIVRGVPDSQRVLDIVFVLVVIFTLVQGPSLSPLARLLRLAPRDTARQILVESAPLDVLDAELLTLTIPPESGLVSVTVLELRLPDPAVITLIIRDKHSFVPTLDTQLQAGDELLIVTTRRQRDTAERRLRAVSRRGPLAHWFDEYGKPE
ncbi:MAG: potassium/hydrogen antiporter [Pseudonocardiales bacterium]|nr:potassium/hydrogen antiporter [Pseudonocardiales bacterium]MDT4984774.1 potassium/hydrogen antiporter [Pseudonocardiales bacterium]